MRTNGQLDPTLAQQPIEALDLSVSCYRLLKRRGCTIVRDLLYVEGDDVEQWLKEIRAGVLRLHRQLQKGVTDV